MAVAILDRTLESLENTEDTREIQLNNAYSARNLSDEQHNARIGEIYARLINPSAKIEDVLERKTAEPVQAPKDIFADKPYLVENARADAEIFRADSPVNRRVLDIRPYEEAETESEEENEDLRPTRTTIQYKTGVTKTVEESKVQNTDAEKRAGLSKKEKIVIGVVVAVIVALFALIIINSAILSGINTEISSLQSSLTTIKASYAGVSDEVNTLLANALKDVENFALLKGLVR